MGNNSSSTSNEESGRPSSSFQSSSSSSRQHGNPPQSSYSQYAQNYPVQHPYPAGYPPPDQYYGPPQTHGAPSHSHGAPPQTHGAPSHSHGAPPQTHGAPTQTHGAPSQLPPQKKFDRRYSRIADNYNSLAEVTEALRRAGLESSNLIIGIDFTKSNEWTGKLSNNGQSLHHIGSGWNPYEQAISIIGKTLADFDDDNLIPCFGFGDASTHDQDVFSFYPDRFCNKFEEVLSRYREIVPHLKLAGPTSFAPIIEMAMSIVEHNGGQYHVLVIIADGQVTRSVDTEPGQLSPQEQKTVQAIVEASKFPLSIILVGVGDGPWDTMKEFDDNIPARDFDNFQFVNFTEIMSKDAPQSRKETEFALASLMEIPSQYKASVELNLLGGRKGNAPERFALPPPVYSAASDSSLNSAHASSFQQTPSSYYNQNRAAEAAPSAFQQTPSSYYNQNRAAEAAPSAPSTFQQTPSSYYNQNRAAEAAPSAPSAPSIMYENQICPICLTNPKDMAFSCGHQTCCDCGQDLKLCPVCRSPIQTRIKLY